MRRSARSVRGLRRRPTRASALGRFSGLAVALVTALAVGPALGKGKPPDFPYEQFRANEETADWLVEYDKCAWHSSDLVMQEPQAQLERLGPEWFCFESEGRWQAVYGRFEPEALRYEVAFHYVYDGSDGFAKTAEPVEEGRLLVYGRALHHAAGRLRDAVGGLGLLFNTYLRTHAGGEIEVWILPASQPDGTLACGGEIHYLLDPTGRTIISEELNFREFFTGLPDPELALEIDREENDVPSVGDIFFLLRFRSHFADVTVRNRCSLTKVLEVEGQGIAWIHAVRERPEFQEKAKKRRARSTP